MPVYGNLFLGCHEREQLAKRELVPYGRSKDEVCRWWHNRDPAEYRRALGLRVGDEVILRLEEGELRILTPRQVIQRAQELVRRYIPEGRALADELIAERRSEAANE